MPDTPALPEALPGQRFAFGGAGTGRLSAYTAGQGAPFILVHSVNAAASAAEVRPVYEQLAASRRVFALDLPGYGHSERGAHRYTPRLMTDALHALRAEVAARCGEAPVDALALSLGCEFLARAAAERPNHWGRLALVSPTGFMGSRAWRAPEGSTREMAWLGALLRGPGWGGALFRGLTRPAVVRYFLRRTWGGTDIDETMALQAIATAAQPGAEHAPLCFLEGALFSADIHTVYESLRQPVWMSHGVRGDFTDYRGKALVEGRPNWRFSVFPTGAIPYFEQPAAFGSALQAFLADRPLPTTV